MRPRRIVAGFDSATAMLRSLASFDEVARKEREERSVGADTGPVAGRDPEAPGPGTHVLSAVAAAAGRAPRAAKERLYAVSGWAEAVPRRRVAEIDSDALAEWVADHYRGGRSDVAFLGSANGALTHLAAALGAPWLPQTLLIPVRRHGVPPEDGREDLRRMRSTGEALVRRNPDWRLHHMHDPVQDRLMIEHMCYFRVKWLRLPAAYRAFLRATLPRGGTLVVSDCALRRPTTAVGERYVFQHGGLGGATQDELRYGGPRVRAFLRAHGSDRRAFDAPEPDGEHPEAEWGFAPELMADLDELAAREGWKLVRLRYDEPESLSPAVADLYRGQYRRRGVPPDRLLAETFMLVEPYWALRTGSVPYWAVFNTQPAQRALAAYLDRSPDFEEIRLGLFSHGVESVGLAGAADWARVLERATKVGTFLGTDPERYPRDFAVLFRFRRELARVRGRHPLPEPLSWEEAARTLAGEPGVDVVPERV
ncbi:hypothetical protein DFP74_2633 [Nocardiopsis sp. Huas11]|uniref:hypothetical protein n=1 Tax=Nocardiopsis sp. Huas11 TaxID=2183912 RepID=UPI000EB1E520|nr:hypothetical protein [Nocardiopsis sp. Huas11]RKS06983.1 hypothetical protein DFP74_2633 [Nocardiopsis sp. Huas11]